jgi:hypothetical protein
MSTHRRTWQKAEGRAAAIFGARRQPGSGSAGRDDVDTRSDSTHPALYIETKLRATHAARALHDATKALARREGKTPILALADKNRPGLLVCIHSDDLETVAVEYCAANASDELEGKIRRAYNRIHGLDGANPPPRWQDRRSRVQRWR